MIISYDLTNVLRSTALLLVTFSFMHGQTTSGLTGIVGDSTNSRLSDVKVTVLNKKTGVAQPVVTNAQGEYNIAPLAPGEYDVIAQGTGGFTGGKVSDAMVSHMDLYPSICDLANVEMPTWLQGKSMLPLIRGEKLEINDELFAEVNYHASYEPKRTVRTRRYNYVRHFSGRTIRSANGSPLHGPQPAMLWIATGRLLRWIHNREIAFAELATTRNSEMLMPIRKEPSRRIASNAGVPLV